MSDAPRSPVDRDSRVTSVIEAIVSKHGDITRNCIIEDSATKRAYLEDVCKIVLHLHSTKARDISSDLLEDMYIKIQKLENLKFDVIWVRQLLDDVSVIKELITESEASKRNLKVYRERIGELESERHMVQCEIEVGYNNIDELQARIIAIESMAEEVRRFV